MNIMSANLQFVSGLYLGIHLAVHLLVMVRGQYHLLVIVLLYKLSFVLR